MNPTNNTNRLHRLRRHRTITITIIAIAAAAPVRIPIFLLDEKLNVKLDCEYGSLVLDFVCSLIFVFVCLREVFSNGCLLYKSDAADE